MNILDLKVKINQEEIKHLAFPQMQISSIVRKTYLEFMEKLKEEILHNGTRDLSLVTIIENPQWDFGYSQIYYDGIFQGHLHRDFVNITFRFEPYDVKNKDYPIPYQKDFNKSSFENFPPIKK